MKRLKQIMSTGLATITPTASLKAAAREMDTRSIGMLVVDRDGTLVGTLTDRDIVVRAVREGWDVNNTPVRDVMTEDVRTIDEEDSVVDAARIMAEAQVRRLLVTNARKEIVGTVSLGDLAMRGEDSAAVAEATRGVSAS
ncbi:CBS domain-containing protein [Roseospira marina]|uniref:CBS domain-containing protein n=1 Tax=Roseospira marina TaxID=140057 RepID=A0A5M6IBI3_9PROT|nr:CBS domain-containing protein [Roseospira marina]KAA5605603.1 CBS domain-containing protein [Roseospira marina]MBB4313329.1 CBS domain-containing protein [Roseospira marina]MBB5085930.1 CBS domain-containing protein [Roseospira marina]